MAAIVLSLFCLAACIGLATAISLADRFPSTLDRYQFTQPGQTSLYRVQYAGGSQGFATSNVVKASSDALSYIATLAPGRGIQVHNTYTNWLGTGALHSRDDYYSRNGERLVEVGQLEAGLTTLFTPPIEAWSPELLAATPAQPIRGSTTVNGTRLDYRAWRDPDETFSLPGGQTRPALRLEADIVFRGTLLTHSESWYVPGLGLVHSKLTDAQGGLQQGLDILGSTELAPSSPPVAVPLSELLAGAGDQAAFFREDAARTGAHPDARNDPAGLRVTYRLQTGANMSASPVFAGGIFYLADTDGQLAAVDAYQATPRWRFSAGGPIVAAPAVAGGLVYFGAADKTLYAVDAQHGMYIWSFRLRDNVASSPVVSDGMVYVGGEDRTLYALDARTGRLAWSATTGDRLVSSPAIAGGRVIIGSDDGVVYAFDAAKGRLLWRYVMDGPVEATPVIAPLYRAYNSRPWPDVVYAASNGQEVAAIDAASGKQIWTATTRFGYLASLAANPDLIYAADTAGTLHAFDAYDGAIAWESHITTGVGFVGSPLALGSHVLAADVSGRLYVWDGGHGIVNRSIDLGGSVVSSATWTGESVLLTTAAGDVLTLQSDPSVRGLSLAPVWQHEFGGANPDPRISGLFSQPVWYKDRPYVVLRGGSLWSLDPQTGEATQLAEIGGAVSANPVISAGVLYAGANQGRVVAYDLASGRWAWQTTVSGSIRFGPAVSEAAVFVDTFSPTRTVVTALNRDSGHALWSRAFANGNSAPALADGRLFVAGDAITALDPASGDVLWKSDPFVALGCLANYQGIVYAGRDLGNGASFVALDGATGKLLWSRTDPVRFAFSRPALDEASQTVLAGATDGELFAYEAPTGNLRWRFQADSPVQSDPQVQDGVVFFTAGSGNLYAVDVASGRLLTNFRPGSPIDTNTAPLVLRDRVYTAQGFRLFALALEAR